MIQKVLVLGVSGMLGHRMLITLTDLGYDVYGTSRRDMGKNAKLFEYSNKIFADVDACDIDKIKSCIDACKPHIVLNCIGIIKQRDEAKNYIKSIEINALFPHTMARLCHDREIRFIHFSTDCVFSGKTGGYREEDISDVNDLYGRTKLLGEVTEFDSALTLRTSIIGHELYGKRSLIEWFLAQEGEINGYTGAIYSGLTTNELSKVIGEVILPNKELSGLYQIASNPISKYDLLTMVASIYQKKIIINQDDTLQENKTLDCSKFYKKTNYLIPSWDQMIKDMYNQEVAQ